MYVYNVENGYLSIVVEWANRGTVTEFIRINKTCDLIWIVCKPISLVFFSFVSKASGIADGLKYFHDRAAVHADLKSVRRIVDMSFRT